MRTTAILLVCCALAGAAAGQDETCVVNEAGTRGTCRSIGQCPKLLPLLRRAQRAGRGSADSDRLLELTRKCPRSAAGRVQICCRNEVTRPVPPPRVVLPTKPDCGQQFIPRVIGGENARIGEFPWMVSIQYIEQLGKPLEHGCGGSLITSRHVLTAAHCVSGLSSPMFPHIEAKAVVLGELNFNTERDCSPERCADPPVTVDIDAIFVHPRFQNILGVALPNDIAVVRLARQVTFSQYIMPVCLLTDVSVLPAGRSDNAPGLRGVVAGWGRSEIGGELRFTPALQKASVPIQEIRVCQRELKITVPLTKRICAGKGEDNADTCRGDSGGPLIVPVNFGEFWYQTGISSFGSMVCGNVAGYTRVFDFADWIVEQINK